MWTHTSHSVFQFVANVRQWLGKWKLNKSHDWCTHCGSGLEESPAEPCLQSSVASPHGKQASNTWPSPASATSFCSSWADLAWLSPRPMLGTNPPLCWNVSSLLRLCLLGASEKFPHILQTWLQNFSSRHPPMTVLHSPSASLAELSPQGLAHT